MAVDFSAFLARTDIIDFDEPSVATLASTLADDSLDTLDLVRRCFEWVRDEVRHSGDFRLGPVTCRASDVLSHRTGYCYAKSHLLAALLRANGIPVGFCYQRLSVDDIGPPFSLHGLNAVHIEGHGWYRMDARGNKPGVNARFSPPVEHLAFRPRLPQEADLPEIWPEPLAVVVSALQRFDDWAQLAANLPDVQLVDGVRSRHTPEKIEGVP